MVCKDKWETSKSRSEVIEKNIDIFDLSRNNKQVNIGRKAKIF